MYATEKAKVEIVHDIDYAEGYNSPYRAIVTKPVDEKYARKLVQDYLKSIGIYGAQCNKLYERYNGIDSQQEDKWVFGLTLSPLHYLTSTFAALHN